MKIKCTNFRFGAMDSFGEEHLLDAQTKMILKPCPIRKDFGFLGSLKVEFLKRTGGQWERVARKSLSGRHQSMARRLEQVEPERALRLFNSRPEDLLEFEQQGTFDGRGGPTLVDRYGEVFSDNKGVLNFGTPYKINPEPLKVQGIGPEEFQDYYEPVFSFSRKKSLSFRFDDQLRSRNGKVEFIREDGEVFYSHKSVLQDKFAFANLLLKLFYFNKGVVCRHKMSLGYKVMAFDSNFRGDLSICLFDEGARFIERKEIPSRGPSQREKHCPEKIMRQISEFMEARLLSSSDKVCIHWDGRFLSSKALWDRINESFSSLEVLQIPKRYCPFMIRHDESANKTLAGQCGDWGTIGHSGFVTTYAKNGDQSCPRAVVVEKIFGEGDLVEDLKNIWALSMIDYFTMFTLPRLPITIRMADNPQLAKLYLGADQIREEAHEVY